MAEVHLAQVCKTYPPGVEAARDVTLQIADGELVALVGPSGSGKTTLLRLIAGLETLSSGQVHIAGRRVDAEPPHRRRVALVAQQPALVPHLNVRDNLRFGLRLRRPLWRGRRLPPEDDRAVEQVARLLQLEPLLQRRPGQLSGGQQQRVALGRALVRRADVYLLDEPLAGLDIPLRREMRRELHLLRRQLHATILYVTHDQEEALSLGDRVVVLDQGRVRQADRPLLLYERPACVRVAQLVGWPPLSLLAGTLGRYEHRPVFRDGEKVLPVPASCWEAWQGWHGRPLLLGLRPEHVRLAGPPTAAEDAARLRLDVLLAEFAGPSTILTLAQGSWVVRTRQADRPPEVGERREVELALSRAHLFDAASGLALAHGLEPAAGV